MTYDDVRRQAGCWLRDLADALSPEEPRESWAQQADRLKGRIRRGYDELLRQRRALERLQQQVQEYEQREAALPWQVHAYLQVGNRAGAWRSALELDAVRFNLAQERQRLCAWQAGYERQAAQLAAERYQLGQLQLRARAEQTALASGS